MAEATITSPGWLPLLAVLRSTRAAWRDTTRFIRPLAQVNRQLQRHMGSLRSLAKGRQGGAHHMCTGCSLGRDEG